MPEDSGVSILLWWKSLASDCSVQVRYPCHHLGLSGLPFNLSKPDAKQDFLQFVENNQLNGQSVDSAFTTHYVLPKFRAIQTPNKGVCNY